jgi:hypothetical protein
VGRQCYSGMNDDAGTHHERVLRGVVCHELAEVDEGGALDSGRRALVEAEYALLRLDLGEGVDQARVAWLVALAHGHEAAVALHSHLDKVEWHRDRLADAAGGHSGQRLGVEGRAGHVLAAEEGADMLRKR